jgi:hypothetical protein
MNLNPVGWAKRNYPPCSDAAPTLGSLIAASGAGAFVGTVVLVPYAQALPKAGLVLAYATIWMGLWFVLFAFTQSLFVAALSLFFVSMGPPIG